MALLVDETAKGIALDRRALPECLHVPIAAVDEDAIGNYVGDVERVVSGRGLRKALLVTVPESAAIDPLLPISDHPNVGIFHARQQVWVHVAYKPYRAAYKRAFPDENIDGLILSHAMNRDTAAHKGFDFVRITPVSGVANLSSAFSEQWAKELHKPKLPVVTRRTGPPFIQYADLSDLMLMLDMMLGGGVMDAVNEGQKMLERKAQS
ncbi:hypothetical protein KMZ29_12545 [Bradyrhizobium sediminis]|uniref:Uncharacterized protein n=1 Tax=Bradyrhizobium sediminis TaxID=2840469 RepID=A0A975NJ02_9BRAD|nr:hypothetical protein [Bradyrhizobium sediminis]QWG15411.1 hypothetical protein KMZ29_12545 [Bradyrhizobium sediminis]